MIHFAGGWVYRFHGSNKGVSMKATTFFLCAFLVLLPLAASAAFTISVSPSSAAWDSNTWVSVRITNNASQGYAANLTIFVDPDSNGAVGAADVPLFNVALRDGQTNRFGATSIPADDDGIANGAILTRIPSFGTDNPLHTIGTYVVQVAFTNGTSPAVTTFTVTQPTTTVYITGRVVSYADDSPVGAAVLDIYPFSRVAGFTPSAWTDTNGAFRIYLPPSMTGNVQGIMANAFGYFFSPNDEDAGEWISAYRFENDLQIGGNALTNSLKVVPAIPTHVHALSGQVVDGNMNPIPFALVMFEEESEDGSDAGALAVADINGDFSLPVPNGMTGWVGAEGGFLNLRGFVASGAGPYTATQDISGIMITCPAATILARNLVIDLSTGAGVAGVGAGFEADMYWSSAYSVTGGLYEIGLVSNTYKAGVDDEMLPCMGYSSASGYEGLGVTNSGIYTDAPFYLARGYVFSGTVFDRNTNALADGEVQISPFGGGDGNGVDVNRHGIYITLAATGSYRAVAQDFNGYLEQTYSNHFTWEGNESGPLVDPVTVTTNGATNINFFLSAASYIRGTVLGTNSPLANANVSVNVGEEGRGGTQTDDTGAYEFAVLAGTNYTVRAQGPDGTFFLHQYWSNKTQDSEADLVTTDTNAPAENINFNLELGGRIEGALYEPDGSTPLIHTWGFVEALTTNDPSDFVAGDDIDQDDGTYSFAIAPGVYHLRAEADGWPDQYYDGVYESQKDQATTVTVEVSQVTGGIDFTMLQSSYVEGNVHSGAILIENARVEVRLLADTNNPWQTDYVSSENSDASGNYSVPVPPGTNYVVVAYPEGGSYYVAQWWSNALDSTQAILFDVGEDETVSNIDFDLELGMRIEGHVFDENDNPMNEIWVNALRENTNGWYDNVAFAQTDSGGYYGFPLSAATSYVVCVQRPWDVSFGDWWYPAMYYNDAFSISSADLINTNAGETVGGVDFHMMLGYRVEGFVMQSDGSTPAPGGWMQARDNLDEYITGDDTDGSGWYEVIVPTNRPLYMLGGGQDLQSEYYPDAYSMSDASAFQPPAVTTARVDFALYGNNEDSDSDGLRNWEEDLRPDGIYKSEEDWASYTNEDTDSDYIDDQDETSWDIDPKLADTDGDTFSDYQEIYVTGTDATASPSGSNSYLHCLQTTRVGPDVIVNWSAIEYAGNYYIQRSTNLLSGAYWIDLFGPMSGTGTVMTVTDSNAPPNSAYRVRIPYIAP